MRKITLFASMMASALVILSCSKVQDAPDHTAPAFADMIIFGGPIYTARDEEPIVEAVAVVGDSITATGALIGLKELKGASTQIIDLEGAAMYPGFVDAHAHLIGIGLRELTLNLEGTTSIAELVDIIQRSMSESDTAATLYGRGWIETGWPEGRMPTKDDLDPVTEQRPVLLERADGHAMVVNSAALKAAGITVETPDPQGGRIVRDAEGAATGLLIDKAMELVEPLMSTLTDTRKKEAYVKGGDVYAAYGWTGLHNMSVDPADVPMMETLSDSNELSIRVYNAVDKGGLDALIESGPRESANGRVETRTMKLYADGALGSRGAALSAPYSDAPHTDGLLLMQPSEALDLFERAINSGVQVVTHAIGDRGNRLVLDWYEQVFNDHKDKKDLRWRVEHSQIVHVEDIPRFSALGVIPSMQPSHAIGDLHFAPARLGTKRLAGAYAWRSLIDAGSIIAGGSDAPVERGDPLIEFYAAVARRDLKGFQGRNWRPSEAVTRNEALKMFTTWPAYAAFQEHRLGVIEAGKIADFTVFSADIMTIAEKDIPKTTALMTIVGGDVIYDARTN